MDQLSNMRKSNENQLINRFNTNYIKLQVQYGSDHYEIYLSSKEKVIHMVNVMDEIERLVKVPKCHQTIIYKGQRLDHQPHAKLNELHIFNNSKLFLSGTQHQFHDKRCCPDHDHSTEIISKEKLNDTMTINSKMMTNSNHQQKPFDQITSNEKSQALQSVESMKSIEKQIKTPGFVAQPDKIYEYKIVLETNESFLTHK